MLCLIARLLIRSHADWQLPSAFKSRKSRKVLRNAVPSASLTLVSKCISKHGSTQSLTPSLRLPASRVPQHAYVVVFLDLSSRCFKQSRCGPTMQVGCLHIVRLARIQAAYKAVCLHAKEAHEVLVCIHSTYRRLLSTTNPQKNCSPQKITRAHATGPWVLLPGTQRGKRGLGFHLIAI